MPAAFTRSQALKAVGLSDIEVKRWERAGLVVPRDAYAFSDIVSLRTLKRLKSKKLGPKRIAAILKALKERWGESGDPLSELKLTADGRRIHVQLGALQMDAGTGQWLLAFADAQASRLVELPLGRKDPRDTERKRREAEHWFQKGVELEQSEKSLDQALDAYRIALALDPALTAAMVNMGTIYFSARQLELAEKYYRMAVETNPRYPLAQFNLGNLYDERGLALEALKHYLLAIELEPGYADAHYNIALVHQTQGETLKAMRHWRIYLRLDRSSHWADLARRELQKLYRSTVLPGAGKRRGEAV